MVFHRDVHAKGLAVSYDEDASFLALMRGAAAASPAPRRRKRAAQAPVARPGAVDPDSTRYFARRRRRVAAEETARWRRSCRQRRRGGRSGVVRVVDGTARAAVGAVAVTAPRRPFQDKSTSSRYVDIQVPCRCPAGDIFFS